MRLFLTLLLLIWGTHGQADESLELYFSNDSINGFQLSDAYETHNMGFIYTTGNHAFSLDLGIVSPDMLIYRNQFRTANRSYGEIATVSYVNSAPYFANLSVGLYAKSSGKFGLNKAQAFAHKLFKLAKVEEINEIVRMPDKHWYGLLANYATGSNTVKATEKYYSFQTTLGSDRGSLKVMRHYNKKFKNFNFNSNYGLNFVAYDDLISSEPIEAAHRKINPILSFGLEKKIKNMDVYIQQRLSLPTIAEDDSVYAVVTAGVRYNF